LSQIRQHTHWDPNSRARVCGVTYSRGEFVTHNTRTHVTHNTRAQFVTDNTRAHTEAHVLVTTNGGDQTKIFGSPDYPIFLDSPFRDGHSVYSTENLFEILGAPEQTCLICTGTPMKTR